MNKYFIKFVVGALVACLVFDPLVASAHSLSPSPLAKPSPLILQQAFSSRAHYGGKLPQFYSPGHFHSPYRAYSKRLRMEQGITVTELLVIGMAAFTLGILGYGLHWIYVHAGVPHPPTAPTHAMLGVAVLAMATHPQVVGTMISVLKFFLKQPDNFQMVRSDIHRRREFVDIFQRYETSFRGLENLKLLEVRGNHPKVYRLAKSIRPFKKNSDFVKRLLSLPFLKGSSFEKYHAYLPNAIDVLRSLRSHPPAKPSASPQTISAYSLLIQVANEFVRDARQHQNDVYKYLDVSIKNFQGALDALDNSQKSASDISHSYARLVDQAQVFIEDADLIISEHRSDAFDLLKEYAGEMGNTLKSISRGGNASIPAMMTPRMGAQAFLNKLIELAGAQKALWADPENEDLIVKVKVLKTMALHILMFDVPKDQIEEFIRPVAELAWTLFGQLSGYYVDEGLSQEVRRRLLEKPNASWDDKEINFLVAHADGVLNGKRAWGILSGDHKSIQNVTLEALLSDLSPLTQIPIANIFRNLSNQVVALMARQIEAVGREWLAEKDAIINQVLEDIVPIFGSFDVNAVLGGRIPAMVTFGDSEATKAPLIISLELLDRAVNPHQTPDQILHNLFDQREAGSVVVLRPDSYTPAQDQVLTNLGLVSEISREEREQEFKNKVIACILEAQKHADSIARVRKSPVDAIDIDLKVPFEFGGHRYTRLMISLEPNFFWTAKVRRLYEPNVSAQERQDAMASLGDFLALGKARIAERMPVPLPFRVTGDEERTQVFHLLKLPADAWNDWKAWLRTEEEESQRLEALRMQSLPPLPAEIPRKKRTVNGNGHQNEHNEQPDARLIEYLNIVDLEITRFLEAPITQKLLEDIHPAGPWAHRLEQARYESSAKVEKFVDYALMLGRLKEVRNDARQQMKKWPYPELCQKIQSRECLGYRHASRYLAQLHSLESTRLDLQKEGQSVLHAEVAMELGTLYAMQRRLLRAWLALGQPQNDDVQRLLDEMVLDTHAIVQVPRISGLLAAELGRLRKELLQIASFSPSEAIEKGILELNQRAFVQFAEDLAVLSKNLEEPDLPQRLIQWVDDFTALMASEQIADRRLSNKRFVALVTHVHLVFKAMGWPTENVEENFYLKGMPEIDMYSDKTEAPSDNSKFMMTPPNTTYWLVQAYLYQRIGKVFYKNGIEIFILAVASAVFEIAMLHWGLKFADRTMKLQLAAVGYALLQMVLLKMSGISLKKNSVWGFIDYGFILFLKAYPPLGTFLYGICNAFLYDPNSNNSNDSNSSGSENRNTPNQSKTDRHTPHSSATLRAA